MTLPASTAHSLSEVYKAIIQVLTLIVALGAPTLAYAGAIHVPGNVVLIFSAVVGVAGSVLHYLVPNTTTDPVVAQASSVKLVGTTTAAS